MLKTSGVFLAVLLFQVAPIAGMVTGKKLAWALSSLLQCEQCARCCNDLPQSKERQRVYFAHDSFPFLFCFLLLLRRGEPQEKANALPRRASAHGRPRCQGRRGKPFIGAQRRPLTEQAVGTGACFASEEQLTFVKRVLTNGAC
jgi:hypothetical protein